MLKLPGARATLLLPKNLSGKSASPLAGCARTPPPLAWGKECQSHGDNGVSDLMGKALKMDICTLKLKAFYFF